MKYLDDSYYIEQVLNGDKAAFTNLVNKHKDMVFTICNRICNRYEEAEEIAQDAFVKAFQALPTFKQKSKFSTWLYRIAYNTAISHTRKKKIETAAIDEQFIENYTLDTIYSNLEGMDEEEQVMIVEKALKELPSEENLMITMFYRKEMTIEEICNITGLTASNVKVKLHRIRKKLYHEIEMLYQQYFKEA